MAVTKEKKQVILKDLEERFQKAKSVYFSHYRGLDVKSLENLRKQMREQQIDFKVAKKTLMRIAAKNKGLEDIPEDFMEGPVGATFSYEDELAGAKLLYAFAKSNEALEILGGIIEGRFVSKAEAIELAQLPSRNELIAKLLGSIKSPISGFYSVLSGVMRNFVYVLKEIHDKMPAEAAAKDAPAADVAEGVAEDVAADATAVKGPADAETKADNEPAPKAEETVPHVPEQKEEPTEEAPAEGAEKQNE